MTGGANMSSEKPQKQTAVQSHIQMPKLLLKRFHNQNNRFFYYDVEKGFIGTKGTAESTNTQFGYYSIETEHYLRDNIETPFGTILAYIDQVDFNQEYFIMTYDFERSTRNFIYALMARDPIMIKEMRGKSFFAQFLPEQSHHDFAAVNGISIAGKQRIFADYILTFMINRTDIPFVLPLGGLYDYRLNGHSVINFPISPQIAICLIHEGYAERMIRDDGTVSMFMVEYPDVIQRMNGWAFASQKKRNWGRVICPERDELDRLMRETTSQK